ncbi:DUF1540 domain-containing protein [Candidatus Clostridium radicumherbarum]|uniref:DUF1540 domain-containing protein n=1 Tax=Candidatus Clostridium radicumherbarum TaxID=3381662 RepID=A0ABW8TXD9_9CLOT
MNGDLSCSALNCVHNMTGLCSANQIHVIGSSAYSSAETMCNTFAEKGIKNAFTHLTNMNIPGEVKQVFTNTSIEMSPVIKCDALNCTYNDNRACSASHVQVHGPDASSTEGTQCETFRK